MKNIFLCTGHFLTRSLLVLLLVGCVTAHQDNALMLQSHADEPSEPSTGEPSTESSLPNIPLTEDLLYQILVAEIAGQRGQVDVAAEHYLRMARSTRDPRIVERAAQIALLIGDSRKAISALELWLDIEPDNVEARQSVVAYLIRDNQPDEALVHLEKLLSAPVQVQDTAKSTMAPEFATEQGQNFMIVAAILGREQDQQTAIKLMERLVASHQDNPDARFAYSNLALATGNMGLALDAIDKALQLKPGWSPALARRADIMQAQGKGAEALNYLQKALAETPQDLSLRLAYARLLVDEQQPEKARQQFEAAAEQAEDNAEVLFALGLLSLQINFRDDAERYLTQVSELGKYVSETSYYLGQIAESRNQYDMAIERYEAVDEGEAYLDAQLRIVGILARQDEVPAARAHLHTIQVQGQQQQKLLLLSEADLLREEEKYSEAMGLYDTALSALPNDTSLLYGRAMLAAEMGKLDLLERDLRSILQREPDNAQVLNALGYTLTDRTDRHQEALGYIERALELSPREPAILDSMGWVHYRLGNPREAVQYLQSASELSGDAEIAAHLGEVLWAIGQEQRARAIWKKALETDPNHEVLQGTIKRFNQKDEVEKKAAPVKLHPAERPAQEGGTGT